MQPRFGLVLPQLARASVLMAILGLGALLPGCSDIHPAPNDTGGGILDAPTDQAVREREASERADEHGMDHNR